MYEILRRRHLKRALMSHTVRKTNSPLVVSLYRDGQSPSAVALYPGAIEGDVVTGILFYVYLFGGRHVMSFLLLYSHHLSPYSDVPNQCRGPADHSGALYFP